MIIGFLIALLTFNLLNPIPLAVHAEHSEYEARHIFGGRLPEAGIRDLGPARRDGKTGLGLDVSADYVIVRDAESGAVLFQKNAETKVPIASITKLITAYVFLETQPDLRSSVRVIKSDIRHGGKFNMYEGEDILLEDVLRLALVASDNTAAIMLARASGLPLDVFVKKMNEKAQSLGMMHASFVEPSGLDPENQASAADVSLLLSSVAENELLRNVTTTSSYYFSPVGSHKTRRVLNTNILLNGYIDSGKYEIMSAKTGFIEEAGYNLTARVYNAEEDASIDIVVLSASHHFDRFTELKDLALWTFSTFEW